MPTARVSALKGIGLVELEEAIVERVMRGTVACEDAFMARQRHVDALERAMAALDRAQGRLVVDNAGELVAEELREAQEALGEITGAFATEDLLARIFSSLLYWEMNRRNDENATGPGHGGRGSARSTRATIGAPVLAAQSRNRDSSAQRFDIRTSPRCDGAQPGSPRRRRWKRQRRGRAG